MSIRCDQTLKHLVHTDRFQLVSCEPRPRCPGSLGHCERHVQQKWSSQHHVAPQDRLNADVVLLDGPMQFAQLLLVLQRPVKAVLLSTAVATLASFSVIN